MNKENITTSAPIIMQQELTSRCNNACGFCYNPERCLSAFIPRETDKEKNILIAKESVRREVMAVCLTGGEPLLTGEHFFEVFKTYKEAGCYTSINSNGRLVTPKIAKRLAENGLNSALISIHGVGELHNQMVGDKAFDETKQGIKNLAEMGLRVIPNFVATAKNVDGLKAVGELVAGLGIRSMTSTPFLPSWGAENHEEFILNSESYKKYFEGIKYVRGLGINIDSTLPIPPCVLTKMFPNEWENFLEVLSPRVCMAGKSFGVISPDGFFRACIQAPYLKEFGGSISDNYEESWKNANKWAEKKLIPNKCQECNSISVCGGGCRTSSLWNNRGSVEGETMYMGEPLTEKQSKPFLKRIEISTLTGDTSFKFKPEIKIRNEGWGWVVFNPNNQSYTVLSEKPDISSQFTTSKKVINTLSAMQAVEPIKNNSENFLETEVIPGNVLFPRLADKLNDSNKTYCLRADTGERYFF